MSGKLELRTKQLFEKYQEYTMIPSHLYTTNLKLAFSKREISGEIVECGTWKGGMIAGIAELIGSQKSYRLYDSFEGLPTPQAIDGASAIAWSQDTEGEYYHDNCSADKKYAEKAMNLSGSSNFRIIKGWFDKTLPNQFFEEGIAILRMDADWYDSTMSILDNLFAKVNPGGVIIIDDYYVWDGCSKAVHDYLSKNQCTERIQSRDGLCYIIKQ